ncbi:MAG TPA: RDD family protein [Ohtaekwangia sp.]|nr:RDD family protein [Ohtaekwangia sp.]
MKNIEIKTTQNVVLQYELADLRDRVIAFFIDLVCLVFGLSIISTLGFSIVASSETASVIFSVMLICAFMFYSLAWEMLNHGQSVGKMAMRIQVIKTTGGQATFSDYAARWVFRMVDIYFSLGGIASILIASSGKAQRIGDIVANTAVVKKAPRMDLRLNDLLSIKSQESYKPAYLQAKQLMEHDALLIKSALDRYSQFKNEAHREVLELLARRVRLVLGMENESHSDDRTFLQTILNDYVVLTR